MRCTILLQSETREQLKQIGKKGQTYDQLIKELIEQRKSGLHDSDFTSPKQQGPTTQ